MKKFTFTLFIAALSISGFSQDNSKMADIQKLLEVTGAGKMGVQVVQNMVDGYKKTKPDVPVAFWDNLMKEVKPETLTNMIIPIYDKYYSAADLKGLIEFYQSPLGQKVLATMPMVMQESMQVGEAWGREIAEKVFNDLKNKGYGD